MGLRKNSPEDTDSGAPKQLVLPKGEAQGSEGRSGACGPGSLPEEHQV